MTYPPYRLSTSLSAHETDIRALAALSNDVILSASRDKTIRSWKRIDSTSFSPHNVYSGHGHYVNSLAVVEPNKDYPNGLIVSGGSDKFINVYDPSQPMEPRQVLKGHTENVCTLNVNSSGHIVSGSWDKKVIVWKNFQKAYEIEGHDAAVWAVLMVEEDLILSASADKLIKLWKNGRLVRVFEGHTDAVRGLALIPGTGFVSCSNDGSLRVWNMDGKCLQELYGHTSFVYSVAVLSSGELLSAGEDRTVKIWKDGECIQTLQQPCVSVWAVTGLPNNDIVVGGSDATVRIFTRKAERTASAADLKEFEDLLASQVISSNQLGDINKDKLPGPEALHNPGKKEGQAIMINTGASVEAYQWVSQGWQKIGEVIGGAGQGTKQTFDGKEYDYVFDIDVGNGPGGNLKLPYNTTQNPYDAAEKFLVHHNLSPSFKDQVADFIISNSREVNSGNTYQDPFTGGSRYTPGATTSHSSDNYMDPFTGQGAYRPGQNNPVASTPSYNDPFTGNSSYKSPASAESQKVKVLPVRTYLFLKQAVPEAVFNKIKALNKELTSIKLTEEELTALTKIITFLKTPSGMSLDGSGLLIVIKMCQEWPVDKRFPALDLLRLITFYAPEELASAVPSRDVVNFIRHVGGLNVTDSNETNAMLSYRALANLFHEEIGREILWGKRDVLSELLQVDISAKYKGKNIRLAESTLAVNFAVLLGTQNGEDEVALGLTGSLIEILKDNNDDESLYRFLMAFGTLINESKSCREVGKIMEASSVIRQIRLQTTERQRMQTVTSDILTLLA